MSRDPKMLSGFQCWRKYAQQKREMKSGKFSIAGFMVVAHTHKHTHTQQLCPGCLHTFAADINQLRHGAYEQPTENAL